MKIVITGSRHWTDKQAVYQFLSDMQDEYGEALEVAHGDSPGGGVDYFVADTCAQLNIKVWPFPVRSGPTGIDGNWPAAGPKRNTRMLLSMAPDWVVGFRAPGKSNGTDHCLRQAEKLGVKRITIHTPGASGKIETLEIN